MPSLICISAANIRHNPMGTSYQVCQLAARMAAELNPRLHCQTIPLVDYNLSPCSGCGSCFQSRLCSQDDDFNYLHDRINRADGLIRC